MLCTYCGDVANTIDHVPPKKLRNAGEASGYVWLEVPACWPCNGALGARRLMTVDERRYWISQRLRRRYRWLLELPEWTSEELKTLGPSLRGMVRRAMVMKAFISQAIQFAERVEEAPAEAARPHDSRIFQVPIGTPEPGRSSRPPPRTFTKKVPAQSPAPVPVPLATRMDSCDHIRTREEITAAMAAIKRESA